MYLAHGELRAGAAGALGVWPLGWIPVEEPGGEAIVAVEVYRSAPEASPELGKSFNEFRPVRSRNSSGVRYQESIHCGLTVFWTRAGR
jgi:hypothetical protein